MPPTKKLLAIDLGAESGRAVLGMFDGQRLRLEVVHRFPNGPVRTLDTMHWDVLRLHAEMLAAMRKGASEHGGADAIGVDTWGVDFALLGRDGTLLGNPRHYRDPHTETIMDAAFARVPKKEIFRQTGLQFMRFNTLFQLLAFQRTNPDLLAAADRLLLMPDFFHWCLCGSRGAWQARDAWRSFPQRKMRSSRAAGRSRTRWAPCRAEPSFWSGG